MVRSALVQPGSDDHLDVLKLGIPDREIAIFNELAKAVTMAAEPWLRETLGREVLADTSALRFVRQTMEDDKSQLMQAWQTELAGDINEVLLVRVPESHAQYLAGGPVLEQAIDALTALIAGWARVWFATVARLLDWQIDVHTRFLEGAVDISEDLSLGKDESLVAVLMCGWTFADGGVILLEWWMSVDVVQRITQRLCQIDQKQDPGHHRSLREGVVRTYRPERAVRTGYAPVLPVEFAPLEEKVPTEGDNGIELIQDIVLDVSAELAKTELRIGELLKLKIGDIVELGKMAGEPMELSLNGHYIARGEVLVLDDRLGIRISEIISPADRLERAQG